MLQVEQLLQERYQLQQKLGQNAGRQTWLAVDLAQNHEQVIVKLLAFSPQMQWEELKLFEREAEVLKSINHSKIPKYRDYFALNQQVGLGLPWFGLVQEYIPGSSLRQLIDRGKHFTEAQVRSFAINILEILTYLHGLNPPVLHRDIKPSNLILGEDEQIYLVDFGAVQNRAASSGATFTIVGTTGYAPLEQFWGNAVPASDLYALGATLIHLLTGITPADLPQQNLRIQFKDKVSINGNFISWIQAITEPDLDKRLSNAQQALELLQSNHNIGLTSQKEHKSRYVFIKSKQTTHNLKIEILPPKLSISILWEISKRIVQCILFLPIALGFGLAIFGLGLTSIIIFFHFLINISIGLFLISLITFLFVLWMSYLWLVINRAFISLLVDTKQLIANISSSSYINFNTINFVIKFKTIGICYGNQQGKTTDINNVYINLSGINIETKLKKYEIGKNLTIAERQWLVQEIKEWLH